MVTNIPIHARAACVPLYVVFDEGNKTRGVKNHQNHQNLQNNQKNHNQSSSQINCHTRHRRGCILLPSISISIAVSEKSGVALVY